MEKTRSSFTNKIGFVMAAAGSAVGLGNIWRFPYLTAQYGGGIFLLVYIILAVTFGFALMTAEIAIGRKTGVSCIGAFKSLNKKWTFLGYMGAIVPVIILPYYSVIGGWVTKYLYAFVAGEAKLAANPDYFGNFVSGVGEPIGWFFLFLGITAIVVALGVEKGVESVSKFMMPILILLSVGIAVYALCMDGAIKGFIYYVKPNFKLFSYKTVLAAMGQLFYSMSLAMGIMITYGSYVKKEDNIETCVRQIEIFDTGVAFLAGLMIIPSVFAVYGDNYQEGLTSGAGLMFKVLPQVFDKMPGGVIVGIAFFLMVLFAALTSSISLMETVVSIIQDKFKLSRNTACIMTIVICFIIGIPSSLGNGIWANIKIMGMDFLTFFDFITNSVLMPIIALLTCIFIGYILKLTPIHNEIEAYGKTFKAKTLFDIIIKYFAPVCIILILASSILGAFGILTI
ncbi:MAG: sodium-dependent transporter [Clostridia bacterium]|nr:sodium-dependent transporter [Clostridia bacterium]